jgi:hypothetical protein
MSLYRLAEWSSRQLGAWQGVRCDAQCEFFAFDEAAVMAKRKASEEISRGFRAAATLSRCPALNRAENASYKAFPFPVLRPDYSFAMFLHCKVFALALLGASVVLTSAAKTAADGRITFEPGDAKLSGATIQSDNGKQHLSFKNPGDSALWEYKPVRWGMYDVVLALIEGNQSTAELEVELAGKSFKVAHLEEGVPAARLYLPKTEPFSVTIRCVKSPLGTGLQVSALTLVPAPEGKPIVESDAAISLHASNAITHSIMMRYEPATNKNCLGYWVNPSDIAEWQFRVTRPGHYKIQLWQGCGKGQGGSEVLVDVRHGAAVLKETRFIVEETGHFQIFVPRDLGRVHFAEAGDYSLWVKPQKKKAGAVMDVRQVLLLPTEAAALELPGTRPTGALAHSSPD